MRIFISVVALFFIFTTAAQTEGTYKVKDTDPEWVNYMYSDNPNIFLLRDKYDAYYKDHTFIKSNHTQYYKRLLKEHWVNTNSSGHIVESQQGHESNSVKAPNSPWEEMGPWDYDHEQAMEFEVQSPGAVHVYTVEQSTIDPDVIYAGTATAGLWKSVDKGMNWELMTGQMDINSVYSIALDPVDVNIVYFGESNGKIWKSVDGGINWFMTGDASFQNNDFFVRDLKIIGPNTILAATDGSLYRSSDGGLNWIDVHYGEHMEIEVKPDDPTVIYTVKQISNRTEFYKSTDNGLNWVLKPAGWPDPIVGNEQKRTEIAVTAADPNVVYVLCSGDVGPDGGLYGIYKSTDAGETFSFTCCGGSPGGTATVSNPNILGWSELGDEGGGQYYYDLALGVSPDDTDRLFAAGVNVWRSLNGGSSWSINGHWVTWAGNNIKHRYSHADVHDIKFFENGGNIDMWVASDGGLYYSSSRGDTLVPRMHGIHGTDFWGFGAGFKNGNVMVGGTYHNGTLIRYNDIYKGGITDPNSGGWLAELGGDNYRGFVNYGDSMVGYSDNGAFVFSDVRSERIAARTFQNDKKCNTSYVTGEYGSYGFSPTCFNRFYSPVGTELYLTNDGGASFSSVYNFGGSKVIQVKVFWANPDVIYLTHKVNNSTFKVMRSGDAGISWTDITPPFGITNGNGNKVKYIELDDKDENKLWCILMGGHSGYKVFESLDGGQNWTNITTSNIYNENVISIVHHYGTDDGLYIGTTKNVYYKNASMPEWQLFNTNLPASTSCAFLEPFYGEGKIRTATQRGVYQCDFYEDAPPVAMLSASTTVLNLSSDCQADTIQFVDHSTVRRASANFSWYFEGGMPTNSTLENPKVIYSVPGTYDVKLVVSDAFGSDSIIFTDFIEITDSFSNSPQLFEDFNSTDFPPLNWKFDDSQGISWEHDWPEGDPSDKVACYPNYWVDAIGEEHVLILPSADFSNAESSGISFDYTYNDNGVYTDSLAVVYRSASSPEWQVLWQKGGSQLEVPGTEVWYWYNTGANITFNNEVIDLSFLAGENCVEIGFANKGYYGNHIWIDNVNLFGSFTGLKELSENFAFIYPNPSLGIFHLRSGAAIELLEVSDVSGKIIQTYNPKLNYLDLDLTEQKSGTYFVKVVSSLGTQVIKIMRQ